MTPLALQLAVGERWWTGSLTAVALERSRTRLRTAAERWDRLAPGESLEAPWRLPPSQLRTGRPPD